MYHKVCEEDRGSLNTLCKTLFWQASHCLLLPSSLLKEIVVTVCVILSNFPRSFGPTLIHKNKQCWHHLFLPLFLSPIQKYLRNAFFMTKQEKPSFQLLVPLLLWSLHFEELHKVKWLTLKVDTRTNFWILSKFIGLDGEESSPSKLSMMSPATFDGLSAFLC